MKKHSYLPLLIASVFLPTLAQTQEYDITTDDPTAAGVWSDPDQTFLMVPKVANGSITADGAVTSAEYGGFTGVNVTPGNPDGTKGSAWILNFAVPLSWDGKADNSFTYYLAHDDNYFYVGVDTHDDVVNSDDSNGSFWKDDAIEIVVDALNDRFDNNTDNSNDPIGGHCYVNYLGKFSGWDDVAGTKNTSKTWASAVDWTYGQTGEIFGLGKKITGGWQMEVRFKKNLFESPTAGNKLSNGYVMGFNIGMDDDDGKIEPAETGTLSVQYFWANRARYKGVDAAYLETLTPEEKNRQVWRVPATAEPPGTLEDHPLGIDGAGRLSHAGTGEIIFGYDESKKSSGKILFVMGNALAPGLGDAGLIALLRAKGYTLTLHTANAADPDGQRAAAVGHDLVYISQSLGSGTVVEKVTEDAPFANGLILRDVDIPIISAEAFMFDNAQWSAHPGDNNNVFSFFGATGRGGAERDTQLDVLEAGYDSLFVKLPNHPIAKGITLGAKGVAKVFKTHYVLNYGNPGSDADVVATVLSENKDPGGDTSLYPTLFVYEKGDRLIDGSVCPNKRIGFFLGQIAAGIANWHPETKDLTEDGKKLIFNTIDYAIGKTAAVPPTLSIARSGAGVTITYVGGALQSSATVNGTYADVSGASPLSVPSADGNRFYRVKGN